MEKAATADRPLTAAELIYLTQCYFAQKEGGIAANVKFIDYLDLPPLRRRECELVAAVLFQRDVQTIMAEVLRAADWLDDRRQDRDLSTRAVMTQVSQWLLPPPAQEKQP